jgi:heme exporter protein D
MTPSTWSALEALSSWLSMGGYGLYVWGSLGMCAAVIAAELVVLRAQRRALAEWTDSEPLPTPARQPVLTRRETAV